MSIQNPMDKIKAKASLPSIETVSFNENGDIQDNSTNKKFFLFFVFILLMSLAFGLGRLSTSNTRAQTKIMFDRNLTGSTTSQIDIPIVEASDSTHTSTPANINTIEVVGSVNSTKYHYLYCPGAKQIAAANKITFKNAAAAVAAGYSLAGNCKPR
jgi:hypothetical protein